jgi:hypothetical protein
MRAFAALAVATSILLGSAAFAEEPAAPATPPAATIVTTTLVMAAPAPVEQKIGPAMGGHTFLPSHLIDDPFSYTSFGTTFGFGTGEAWAPTVTWNPPADPTLGPSKWYGYTGLALGLSGTWRFLEYLSIRATAGGGAYLGNGGAGVLTIGSSVKANGQLGVKGSLPVGERLRFAATFDVNYGPVYSVLIAQGIKNAIDQCRLDPANCRDAGSSILQTEDTVTWIGGLSGAWAPWAFLGLTLNAQFIAPTKTGTNSSAQNGVTLAAMADFDVKPLLHWLAMGVNATYSNTFPIGGDGVTTTQEFGFGLYYTGRKDLALGVEMDWRLGRLSSQQVSQSTLAWINFKYYWN